MRPLEYRQCAAAGNPISRSARYQAIAAQGAFSSTGRAPQDNFVRVSGRFSGAASPRHIRTIDFRKRLGYAAAVHGIRQEPVPNDGPECLKSVLPSDLLTLFVRAPVIRNRHLVHAAAQPSD